MMRLLIGTLFDFCIIFALLDITTQQVLLSGNLNKVLRKTSTETEEKSGRSDFAASYDENNKCISSIGRKLRDEQRSELVSGDSESHLGMGDFEEVVEKALNMQTASEELDGKRKANTSKSMETPLTRKPPMSEEEKCNLRGQLKKEGKPGRKLFASTGMKGKGSDSKNSQSITMTQSLVVQEEVERLKASLARKLKTDWSHRRGILSRKRLNFDEFEKVERGKDLKHLKHTSKDVEIIDLECDAIDEEMVKEEASRTKTTVAGSYQTSIDDLEILEIITKKDEITSNEDVSKDYNDALNQRNSFKSVHMSDIITLDEQEESEDDNNENNLSSSKDNIKMLEKEIVELEEVNLASHIPESSSDCSSAFFALENNDSKALSKRSFAATQMSCDNEPSFKTLKMSNPITLDENEDVIELD